LAANLDALQIDSNGLSSMALLESSSLISLSNRRAIDRLVSDSGRGCHAPITKLEEEQLSAITSSRENLKFEKRESMISIAGAHAEMY